MLSQLPSPDGTKILVIVSSISEIPTHLIWHPNIQWTTLHMLYENLKGESLAITKLAASGTAHTVFAITPLLFTEHKLLEYRSFLEKTGFTFHFFTGNHEQLFRWAAALPEKRIVMNSDYEVVVIGANGTMDTRIREIQKDTRINRRIQWRSDKREEALANFPEGTKLVLIPSHVSLKLEVQRKIANTGIRFIEKSGGAWIAPQILNYFQQQETPGPEIEKVKEQPAPDQENPLLVLCEPELPMELQPHEDCIYVFGINPVMPDSNWDMPNQENFVRVNTDIVAKTLQSMPEDLHAAVILGSVTGGIKEQLIKKVLDKNALCIAIPNWKLSDFKIWANTAKFDWSLPKPRETASAQKPTTSIPAEQILLSNEPPKEQEKTLEPSTANTQQPAPTMFQYWQGINSKQFCEKNFELASTIAKTVKPGENGWETLVLVKAGVMLGFSNKNSLYAGVNSYVNNTGKKNYTGPRRREDKATGQAFEDAIKKHIPEQAINPAYKQQHELHAAQEVFAGGLPKAAILLSPVLEALTALQNEITKLTQVVVQLESDCEIVHAENEALKTINKNLEERTRAVVEENKNLAAIKELIHKFATT